ncbi:hypothetical protein MMC08_006392 [Hypocenomyce scalaris]|nr:hypothetical protein [Hypocenomyce scalaris]
MSSSTTPSTSEPDYNYLFKISLCPNFIKNPPITRTLSVPATMNFWALHRAIQVSFGWQDCTQYRFDVGDTDKNPDSLHRKPLLRLLSGPGKDTPLWRSTFSQPTQCTKLMPLSEVFEQEDYKDEKIYYQYDLLSNWDHTVEMVGREPLTEYIYCTTGQGHPAGERGWGPVCWEELKKAYRSKTPTEDQQTWMRWYEQYCTNGDKAGLRGGNEHVWDRGWVNQMLEKLPHLPCTEGRSY